MEQRSLIGGGVGAADRWRGGARCVGAIAERQRWVLTRIADVCSREEPEGTVRFGALAVGFGPCLLPKYFAKLIL